MFLLESSFLHGEELLQKSGLKKAVSKIILNLTKPNTMKILTGGRGLQEHYTIQ